MTSLADYDVIATDIIRLERSSELNHSVGVGMPHHAGTNRLFRFVRRVAERERRGRWRGVPLWSAHCAPGWGGGEGDEDHGGAVCDANDAPSPPLLTPASLCPPALSGETHVRTLWRRGRRAGG